MIYVLFYIKKNSQKHSLKKNSIVIVYFFFFLNKRFSIFIININITFLELKVLFKDKMENSINFTYLFLKIDNILGQFKNIR